ncbi:hypothetical protein SAY87_000379 [Trapa incisa]|uniref:Uncharacterized protein n=1 Tax=Trapa incisa TaxID=236973 RepID=A0AAN7GEF6_9MYRT|nr:hypothetical protein SAY87_000379 [Trapa incisa]
MTASIVLVALFVLATVGVFIVVSKKFRLSRESNYQRLDMLMKGGMTVGEMAGMMKSCLGFHLSLSHGAFLIRGPPLDLSPRKVGMTSLLLSWLKDNTSLYQLS